LDHCCIYAVGFICTELPFRFARYHPCYTERTNKRTGTFKNPILGYNIFGFRSATEKALINTFNPTTIRFPHGLFANWYDWRTDKTRVFGTETFYYIHRGTELKEVTEIGELGPINTMDRLNMYVGIDGLEQLNNAKKATNQGAGLRRSLDTQHECRWT
jgi:hypothetical protein